MTNKTLENVTNKICVSLSKKELELIIDKLAEMPITNKQALDLYQKLTEKLEKTETLGLL